MAIERTLSIIKPDACSVPGASGEILSRFEKAGLRIIAMKKIQLSEQLAQGFYAVHKERPFYGELVTFMTSGPVVVSGPRRRERDPGASRPAGAHELQRGTGGHDSRRLRHGHRAQRHPWLRCARDGEHRDLVLLRRRGDPGSGGGALARVLGDCGHASTRRDVLSLKCRDGRSKRRERRDAADDERIRRGMRRGAGTAQPQCLAGPDLRGPHPAHGAHLRLSRSAEGIGASRPSAPRPSGPRNARPAALSQRQVPRVRPSIRR